MDPNVTPFYLDKAIYAKLLFPLVVIVVGFINSKFGLQLDATAIDIFIAGAAVALVTFIVMHKYKTTQLALADKNAAVAVDAVKTQDPAVGLAVK